MNIEIEEEKLANKLVTMSCRVQPNENVLIEYGEDVPKRFIIKLINEIFNANANPYLKLKDSTLNSIIIANGNNYLFNKMKIFDTQLMENMDCVILIGGAENIYNTSIISSKQKSIFNKLYNGPVHLDIRIKKKWVLLEYPTSAFAQNANLSTTEAEKYVFSVCNLDYSKMSTALENLKILMQNTNKIQVIANETNITLSKEGIGVVKCCGECNIPDGEIYTAPVKNSINGKITFNMPIITEGIKIDNIMLEFKEGKIINFNSSNNEKFQKILDTDEGSKYIGEWSIGINPNINKPICDILFDEKMCKSIHMAIGNAYTDADNGNRSAIHLDIIQSHDINFGGGKIYFDDVLIRENGIFILPNLLALNPENLV